MITLIKICTDSKKAEKRDDGQFCLKERHIYLQKIHYR